VLSTEMDHTETVVMMLDECRRMGLEVLPPDINRSRYRFSVVGPRRILYGLGAIRGVGAAALEGVIEERERKGPFNDLFDFCRRIDLRKANKRVLEALSYSGALDAFGLNRPSLLATLPKALQLAERQAADASAGIGDLFGLAPTAVTGSDVSAIYEADWPEPEKLAREKETLGFYLSGHPIESYRSIIDAIGSGSLKQLISQQNVPSSFDSGGAGGDDEDGPPSSFSSAKRRPRRTPVVIGCWLADVRNVGGERPGKLLTLDDRTAQVVCWIDFDAWMKYQGMLKKDTLVFAAGDLGLSQREGREPEWRLYAKEFKDLDAALRDGIERIVLRWQQGAAAADRLKACIEPVRSATGAKIAIEYRNSAAHGLLELGQDWRVRPDWEALERLRRLLGPEQVCIHYRKWQPQPLRFDAPVAE